MRPARAASGAALVVDGAAAERERVVRFDLAPAHAPHFAAVASARHAVGVRLERRQVIARFRVGGERRLRGRGLQARHEGGEDQQLDAFHDKTPFDKCALWGCPALKSTLFFWPDLRRVNDSMERILWSASRGRN